MFLRCITQDMGTILKSDIFQHCPPDLYLAGGTAVALYFGHRLSVDLDFFTDEEFDSLSLSSTISVLMGPSFRIAKTKVTKNTLVVNLNETGFSLFTYPYPVVAPLTSMQDIPVQVASQIDLALMKLVAINQRGSCKDFIDLKILLEQNEYPFEFLMEKEEPETTEKLGFMSGVITVPDDFDSLGSTEIRPHSIMARRKK